MSNLAVFSHESFGNVRTAMIDGNAWCHSDYRVGQGKTALNQALQGTQTHHERTKVI